MAYDTRCTTEFVSLLVCRRLSGPNGHQGEKEKEKDKLNRMLWKRWYSNGFIITRHATKNNVCKWALLGHCLIIFKLNARYAQGV